MEELSVLLVEDNPADAMLIEEYVAESSRERFSLAIAETLAEAIDRLAAEPADVVLLDLSLPDSSGIETVRTFCGRFPQLAIVVLTGLDDENMALQAVRYGAQDYLVKNDVTPLLLNRSIRYAVERKRAVQVRNNLIADLSSALDKIEFLQRMLPICVSCTKIRDNEGNWQTLEEYGEQQAGSRDNLLVCPSCSVSLYADPAHLSENESR